MNINFFERATSASMKLVVRAQSFLCRAIASVLSLVRSCDINKLPAALPIERLMTTAIKSSTRVNPFAESEGSVKIAGFIWIDSSGAYLTNWSYKG